MAYVVRTIGEQVYQNIWLDIRDGVFAPGAKLTIKALEERLGVSSSPIREALSRLQQDGVIEYQPNIGMRVLEYSAEDIRELYSLMAELDVLALHFAFGGPLRTELLKALPLHQKEALAALSAPNPALWEKLSDEFHLLFYQYCQNSRLCSIAEKMRMQLTFFSFRYQKEAPNREQIQKEHDAIITLLLKKDLSAAEQALRSHYKTSMKFAEQALLNGLSSKQVSLTDSLTAH